MTEAMLGIIQYVVPYTSCVSSDGETNIGMQWILYFVQGNQLVNCPSHQRISIYEMIP